MAISFLDQRTAAQFVSAPATLAFEMLDCGGRRCFFRRNRRSSPHRTTFFPSTVAKYSPTLVSIAIRAQSDISTARLSLPR
jgi:hypothetical protein